MPAVPSAYAAQSPLCRVLLLSNVLIVSGRRDASALDGGLSDYLLHEARNEKRERHAKGVDMKHDPATVLRKLANSLEANGQSKDSAECQLLADKYDALNQVNSIVAIVVHPHPISSPNLLLSLSKCRQR